MALDPGAERVLQLVRSAKRPPYETFSCVMGKIIQAAGTELDAAAAALRAGFGAG